MAGLWLGEGGFSLTLFRSRESLRVTHLLAVVAMMMSGRWNRIQIEVTSVSMYQLNVAVGIGFRSD